MEFDEEKFFGRKKEEKGDYQGKIHYKARVIPGLYVFLFGVVPIFFAFIFLYDAVASSFPLQYIFYVKYSFILWLIFSFCLGIVIEIRQPFSATSTKQSAKGRFLRGLAMLDLFILIACLIYSIYSVNIR